MDCSALTVVKSLLHSIVDLISLKARCIKVLNTDKNLSLPLIVYSAE